MPDLSLIAPLGSGTATACPVSVQYDVLPPEDVVPVPRTSASQERMEIALDHKQAMLDRLAGLHPDAVVIPPGEGARTATLEAIAAHAPLILGPVIPQDLVGRRRGNPAALLRLDGGYAPIIVKSHGVTSEKPGRTSVGSTLEAPADLVEHADTIWSNARSAQDVPILAHFWRMLEAAGIAATTPRGAVLDRSERLWWVDLTDALLDSYDHEFGLRRDIALATVTAAPGAPRAALPYRIRACETCRWQPFCAAELAAADHLSLLGGFQQSWFATFERHGIVTRRAVAGLDRRTAEILDALTPGMLAQVQAGEGELDEVLEKKPGLLASLAKDGITTVVALRDSFDPTTLALSAACRSTLPGLIDLARAVVTGGHHRRRGSGALKLPAEVVEVDVDMESTSEGQTYLWGMYTSVDGAAPVYEPVDSYDETTDLVEAEVFVRFWARLAELRAQAEARGGALRAYHWTAAELTVMRRIVRKAATPEVPSLADLDAVIQAEWVDLATVWDRHVLSAHGKALKAVASSIGHAWEEGETGGDFSMLQHQLAVAGTPDERAEAIRWLRQYNADDVEATYEVRSWLRENLAQAPRIEDWTAPAPR
ncbi:MAG: ribonuclease H-like domain-containing protein [Marmoricola sp.]